MELPPLPLPSHSHYARSKPKSLSSLARSVDTDDSIDLTTTLLSSPPPPVKTRSPPRQRALPLQELLLLSPCKPRQSSRSRLADRLYAADELARRARGRDGGHRQEGTLRGSPRRERRSRRVMDLEGREEKGDEYLGKVRRRKRTGLHGKDKENRLSIVPLVNTSACLSPRVLDVVDDGENGSLDRIGQVINDLVMWRDTAKSTLWFGLGCACFLSSCFAKGINFSIFSATCQIGLLFLGLAFFSNSLSQRSGGEKKRHFKLNDEDIVKIARLVLPAANLVISKMKELFSGEPSMTLKVAPFLLMGAEHGQMITLRRLCAVGFFASFTVPKLYSCYMTSINEKAEFMKQSFNEKWNRCAHKKIVATSAIMAFWHITSIKTRILTAFISIVIVRYYRQQSLKSCEAVVEVEEEVETKALVISNDVSKRID
ncbi:hypothetical protein MLD38_030546 [Melastoma candidum]|uniref:Uncharacterized protein n=1 Tax=Melastoma candidum TaxID=119954 RepID=A0ACB9MLI2_9MYRT|nr:hypothetical protein MLD38_030546 [Melastoma candidum]